MKKLLIASSLALSFSSLAAGPVFDDITQKDVDNVSKEFGANFAHTAVAAPETNGLWGVEVGIVGGQTKSPDFADVVGRAGGKKSDFENIYHAGAMARVHVPFDLFAEVSFLPKQEISDVKVKSQSFGVGWNVGGFFEWPVDVAIGYDRSSASMSFFQQGGGPIQASNIALDTTTSTYWVGVSKTFLFFTPYAKIGKSKIHGELEADANVFFGSVATSKSANTDGNFMAIGANIQLFFIKLGVEASKIQDVNRVSAKFSLDF